MSCQHEGKVIKGVKRCKHCGLDEVYWSRVLPASTSNPLQIAAAVKMADALRTILGFFESGEFVRDTSRDFEQGWHLKMIPVVKSLADANAALVAWEKLK